MELDKDFKEFIELLNDHDVNYLVIGGYAVNSKESCRLEATTFQVGRTLCLNIGKGPGRFGA